MMNSNLKKKPRPTFKHTDQELIGLAICGEQKAFEQLYRRHYMGVKHTVLKYTRHYQDMEDLINEAFAKAFIKLDCYVPTHKFSTWLSAIARNNCIDFSRKKNLLQFSLDDGFENGEHRSDYQLCFQTPTLSPEEGLIKTQRHHAVRKLVQQLDHKYRSIVELRYYDELPYDEIAEQLDLPTGTVKAQLFRAKQLLHHSCQQTEVKVHWEERRRKK